MVTTTSWVIGFVVGLVGALLFYLFFMVGVALVATGFGWALGSGFLAALGFDPGFLVTIVGIGGAIVVALLTLAFSLQKYVIIAITAIGGANALVLSVLLVLGRVSLESLQLTGNSIKPILQDSWSWLIVWLARAIASIFVQVWSSRSYTFSKDQSIEGWR